MPLGNVQPCYRDEWPAPPSAVQQLWEPLLLAPILGAPEIVVPAGQIDYDSRVSGRKEVLPVCVSMMGLPGTDLSLMSLVKTLLEKSRRPAKVLTGRTMF